jgi:hypothetical protein
VANKLTSVSPSVLQSLADHLEREGKLGALSKDEQDAMDLLKQVNAVSAQIPGSQVSKIFVRNEIGSTVMSVDGPKYSSWDMVCHKMQ